MQLNLLHPIISLLFYSYGEDKIFYYYLKVVHANNRISVSAPIWVKEVEKFGINSVTTKTVAPVKGESMTLDTDIYNDENDNLIISKIEYYNEDNLIGLDNQGYTVESSTTQIIEYEFMPTTIGIVYIYAKVTATLNGFSKYFQGYITFDIMSSDNIKVIGIDGSKQNEYVTGNYANSMVNFTKLAAEYKIQK